MTDKEIKIAALENELEKYKAECESIAAEMQESRKNVRKDALANLRRMRSEFNDANAEHEKADDARDACRAALCSCVIGQRDPIEVQGEVRSDVSASQRLKKCAERRNPLWPALAALLLAIVFAAVGVIFNKPTWWETIVFAAISILLFAMNRKRVKESRTAEKSRDAILAKYRADDEEMIKAREKEFQKLHRMFTEAEEVERSTAAHLEYCRAKLEALESRTLDELDFSCGSGEAAELTRLFNERTQLCQAITMEIEKLKNE